MIRLKTVAEIDIMREGGKMLATVLNLLISKTQAGMTTKDLAMIAGAEIKKLGGEPSFFGYSGFPDVICISVNEQVVHGIPSDLVIKDGDIVSLDFGVKYKGMFTDAARSLLVGPPDKSKSKFIEITERSLNLGLDAIKAGARTGDIGAAVQHCLEANNYGVVRALIGHGVGFAVHEDPDIPNYGERGTGQLLNIGAALAVEPMSTIGTYDVAIASDGWTVVTRDNSLSAHFEDTVVVTKTGCEIITRL